MSVCVPAYNGARYLMECLESLRAQTLEDFELIAVDDASTDGTRAILERVAAEEPRMKVFRNERNLGLVANWNRCARLARAQWVKFVFQDDVLAPSCLERLYRARDPRSPLVVCRRAFLFEPGVPAGVREMYRRHLSEQTLEAKWPGRSFVSSEELARLVLAQPGVNCIGEPTSTLVRRDAFRRFGFFNPDLVSLCDWEFFARVAVNAGLARVPEVLATFRVHPGSESALNRSARAFQSDHLDELIIRHELAFAPAYAPVRRAALGRRPAADIVGSLALAAARCAARAGGRAEKLKVLERALGRYPRLSRLRPAADRRLAAARGLWSAVPAHG